MLKGLINVLAKSFMKACTDSSRKEKHVVAIGQHRPKASDPVAKLCELLSENASTQSKPNSCRKGEHATVTSQTDSIQSEQNSVFMVLEKGVFGIPFNATLESVLDWCKENNLNVNKCPGNQTFASRDIKPEIDNALISHLFLILKTLPTEQSLKLRDNHLVRLDILLMKDGDEFISYATLAEFRNSEQFDLVVKTLSKKYGKPRILREGNGAWQSTLSRDYLSEYILRSFGIPTYDRDALISWGNTVLIHASPLLLESDSSEEVLDCLSFRVLHYNYSLTENINDLKYGARPIEEQRNHELQQERIERLKRNSESAMENF